MSLNRNTLVKTIWSAESNWIPRLSTLTILCVSLFLFGVGEGLLVLASLGASPWTVLAQGISLHIGANIGLCTFFISLFVMFTWIPFKQQFGLGTVLNILFIALGLGISTQLISPPEQLLVRFIFSVLGIVFVGVASAFYLTCCMGAGPRDGLMVGLYQASGLKIGTIRTSLEIIVCFIGWSLGGIVGVSTLLFAFGVGWVLQISLYLISIFFSEKNNKF